jgi:aminoglycoside phosphotransferase (APT) family kinase protein
MLSALATSAVPGFHVVSAQQMSNAERDSALIHDVDGVAWVIDLPTSEAEQQRLLGRVDALSAITEGLRQRLSFKVPRIAGTTDVQGKTLVVQEYLPGSPITIKSLTSELQASLGSALASIHELPTSTVLEHKRLAESSLDELREAAGIVDKTAASGVLPQSLLRRWETACEDRGLWHFEPTVIHRRMQLGRFLVQGNSVVGVTGWRLFGIGDPARDLAWLTTPASAGFAQGVITAYRSHRPSTDRWFLQRARFWAELDVARWLLHGLETSNDHIIQDATDMLQALNDRVAGDMDSVLTQPISQQRHPLAQ